MEASRVDTSPLPVQGEFSVATTKMAVPTALVDFTSTIVPSRPASMLNGSLMLDFMTKCLALG